MGEVKQLTHEEEVVWRDRIYEVQLAALKMKRAANAEVRAYREYMAVRYRAGQDPVPEREAYGNQ